MFACAISSTVDSLVSNTDAPDRPRKKRAPRHPPLPSQLERTLEDVERDHALAVLAAVGGNRAIAARVLGVDRKTLYRRLRRWGWTAG
jgi:transcriptional regulator of acetoin/glycerol metabolism